MFRFVLLCLAFVVGARAATFGTVVSFVGGASDIVLDEPRGRLYLVNPTLNRLEVYSIPQRRFLNPVRVDGLPLAAAMSRSGRFLYVAAFDGSRLSVIDLDTLNTSSTVSLPAKPEGLAVGGDERVLISTAGTGANNAQNVLLVYDPNETATRALTPVLITPPPPANPLLPPPSGRVVLASRSQLTASRDGSLIIGVNIPNTTSRTVFVYEVASATVVRSRTVLNVSSVISIAPDNSTFMAGLYLFDTETLEIIAQQNAANAPYPFQPGVNFNTQQNQGGSVYAPDNSQLYSAFNFAPVQNPPARANVSQLLYNDPSNLLIRQGIQMPENLSGKMVITSDGGTMFATSESGFVILPLSQLRQSALAAPQNTTVLLANDQCGVTARERTINIPVRNEGSGRLTVQAQLVQLTPTGPGGVGGGGGAGGGQPGGGVIIIVPPTPGGPVLPAPVLPGGNNPVQNTNIAATAPSVRVQQNAPEGPVLEMTYTTSATARVPGTVSPTHTFTIFSNEAVNIPPAVRVFQNFRDAESRGELVAIETGMSANEALEDMVLDGNRNRLYIANSGKNRIEVYDTRNRRLLEPIKVGQLPRSLAIAPDGNTMYVANSGGESISVVDLATGRVSGRVRFPPLPFNANAPLVTPSIVAAGLRGPQVIMSNGTIWRVVGNDLVPRPVSTIIGTNTIPAPRTMSATPNGEYIVLLAGNGFVYLYDALADDFVQGRQIFTNPIQGYYGPVAAGPRGQYFLVNGTVLNQALTPVANAGTVVQPGPVRPGVTPPTTGKPVSAVAAVSGNQFLRFAQPARTTAVLLASDPAQIEVADVNTGNTIRTVNTLEGPISTLVGTQRVNLNGRTLAYDPATNTAFAITTSGLSVVGLDIPVVTERPTINNGGIVNLASYTNAIAPNSLISIFGRNLGDSGMYSSTPLPTLMGGVCVTLNNNPLPLLMTSSGQINAQIPPELPAGRYPLIVRNVQRQVAAPPAQLTITRYAPAIFADPESKYASIYKLDGRPVSRDNPARRDERLVMYATGLGQTTGGRAVSGQPSPSQPLGETADLQVFFGRTDFRQSEMIVEWSGLVPGLIGVYQVNLYVPGDRMRGADLPVTLRIGGVESQKTGPVVPIVAVD